MAESSNSRVVDISEIADDDPFAELTRIMGHDPRVEASKAQGEAPENDLEIDLENELLGGLAEIESVPDEGMAADGGTATEAEAQEVPEFGDDFDDAFEAALSNEFDEASNPEDDGAPAEPEEADIPGLAPASATDDLEFEPLEATTDGEDVAPVNADAGQDGTDDDLEGTLESLLADPAKDMEHFSARQPEDITSETAEEADPPFDYTSAAAERHDYLGEPEEAPRESAEVEEALRESAEPEAPRQQAAPHEEWSVADDDPFGIIAGMNTVTQAPPEAPDVETVDVGDRPVAVTDDLDIPDVSYREEKPVASEFDELETELAGAFGDMGGETARPESRSVREDTPDSGFEDLFGSFEKGATDDAPRQADREAAAAAAPARDRWQDPAPAHDAAADLPFDPAELEDFPPPPGGAADRESGGRRNALVIAAVVAGVAIAGGAGAFALWSGDDGGGAPAMVMADDDPIKVKPENPGGTKVPNQNNEVYQRLSDVAASEEPTQQEKLVTTAEEPMDVSAGATPRTVAFEAPADDTAATASAEEPPVATTPEPVKSEARLAPTTGEGTEVADEVVAVAPRKVRTFVVRPDGTMVPREMPQPAAETTTSDALPGVEVPEESTTVAAETPAAGATSAQDAIVSAAASDPAATPAATIEAREAVPSGQAPEADAASSAAAADSDTNAAEGISAGQTAADAEEVAAASVNFPATAPIPRSRPSAPRNTAAASAPANPALQPAAADTAQQQQVARAEPAQQAAAPVTEAVPTEWSVQISSQPSIPAAQQSYRDLAQRYSDLLSGQGVNIVRAEIEGRGTYYRVRIPSQSKDDAIALCERLQAAGGNCFVSR